MEGSLKVTGRAHYTADVRVSGAVHAALVHSTIANGRIASVDTSAVRNAKGVLAVFTHHNMPRMNPTPKPWSHLHPHGQGYLPLQDENIHYAGQPIALVVASRLDQAMQAGTLIKVRYDAARPVVFGPGTMEASDRSTTIPLARGIVSGRCRRGTCSRCSQDRTGPMQQPDRHHNQMEPHATTAMWDTDGSLTVYDTTQHIYRSERADLPLVLGVPVDKINIISEFLGGGFGGKAYVWPHTLLAILAAKALTRPVRLQLTRAQMYSMVGRQAATVQTISLAADKTGKLTGIHHESISPTSVFDNYIEYAAFVDAVFLGGGRRHRDES